MKFYHGSPKSMKLIKPQQAKGLDEFENQKAVFLTDSFKQAALYAIGKTLKNKTVFALPPNKLIIVGNQKPSKGYVYTVNVKVKKGDGYQYAYPKIIKKFTKKLINPEDYKKNIIHVDSKEELIKMCIKEKREWLKREGYCIPKLKFTISKPENYLPTILRFLNPKKEDWDWSERIYKHYPNLKNRIKDIKNKEKRREIEYNFFKKIFQKEKEELQKKSKYYQREWDKINEKIMIVLSKVVEQDWSEKDRKILARVSLNPICPRYIKQRTFDIFYKKNLKSMKSTAIHEIFHFIYFEKWKKVFPKTKEKEFDAPYLVWHLSEMVPKIVLNDKRIQKIFRYKFGSYKEYENFKIDGKPFLSYLQVFYDNRKDFVDFLKKSWKFVKAHKGIIK